MDTETNVKKWYKGTITVIHKTGPGSLVKNYRPISLPSVLSVVKAVRFFSGYFRDSFSQNILANQNSGNLFIITPNFITVEQRY